jgi:hypothetical protein
MLMKGTNSKFRSSKPTNNPRNNQHAQSISRLGSLAQPSCRGLVLRRRGVLRTVRGIRDLAVRSSGWRGSQARGVRSSGCRQKANVFFCISLSPAPFAMSISSDIYTDV